MEPTSVSLRARFQGCILGQAVGDALGAPYEGVPADFIYWTQGNATTLLNPTDQELIRYTDDTQMLIGVAETLISKGSIDEKYLRERFLANYDPERGYGAGARQLFERVTQGEDWDHLAGNILPGGSFGNGAAMRVAPVGLLFHRDLQQVAEEARRSAWPTHRHPLGIEGAQLLAVAVALALGGHHLDRKSFYRLLTQFCQSEEFGWQVRAARKLRRGHSVGFLGNSLPAHRSVVTAIACFTTAPSSYEEVIAKAITLGDDTDTLAAMAGALSGAHLGVDAIPTAWIKRLESGPRGVDYLRLLADQLYERFAANLPQPAPS